MVALLAGALPWRAGWRVLDVGCGAGRHARALVRAGARPVGLDLSRALLRRAREVGIPLIRADMRRLPVRPASFDLAVNLFTSFGYFASDEDHARVIAEVAAALRPGGWFAMDFLRADSVVRSLVPSEELATSRGPVRISRALAADGLRVVKSIRLPDGRQFEERVRLFQPEELEEMLSRTGLQVVRRWGDYEGGPPRAGAPRVILLAQRGA